jgi:hypothetical protein
MEVPNRRPAPQAGLFPGRSFENHELILMDKQYFSNYVSIPYQNSMLYVSVLQSVKPTFLARYPLNPVLKDIPFESLRHNLPTLHSIYI